MEGLLIQESYRYYVTIILQRYNRAAGQFHMILSFKTSLINHGENGTEDLLRTY